MIYNCWGMGKQSNNVKNAVINDYRVLYAEIIDCYNRLYRKKPFYQHLLKMSRNSLKMNHSTKST